EFWKSMILDVDKTITTQALSLKNYISVGLPPQLRGALWQLISKSRNQSSDMEGTYWELLKRTSPFEKEIQHDLDHSFPLSNFFTSNMSGHNNDILSTKCQSMCNILKAYSLFDQDTGYSQGLSYIIALFLTQVNEVAVFCLVVQLMGPYGLKGHLASTAETLQLQLYQFDHLLELTLPELHRYLGNLGVQPETYATRWFTTCFSYQSNPSLAAKVMDLVFIEGTQVLQRFILALLKRNQHTIMKIGFEHLMKYFQNNIFDVYKDNENEFVIDMYMIDIPTKLHTRLAKQFKNEMARKEKQRNQEEMMRQANEQLMTYIQELQEKYRVLEMEHQEMTRQAVETKMSMAKMNSDNDSLMHQLKQLRSQHESTERHKDTEHQSRIEEIYQSNRHLIKQNASLQDQIADMEAVLIGLKMNYAERETEYESLRRQLLDAQKAAQKN
ncbi:rab-GTPase-TBC domain-containing protein, partial [Cunninghamella echinulata]